MLCFNTKERLFIIIIGYKDRKFIQINQERDTSRVNLSRWNRDNLISRLCNPEFPGIYCAALRLDATNLPHMRLVKERLIL